MVDDSAVVRQMMTEILRGERSLTVSVAPNPLIALDKMQRCRPDVVVLDLEMPEMDGLSFLEKVMARTPSRSWSAPGSRPGARRPPSAPARRERWP